MDAAFCSGGCILARVLPTASSFILPNFGEVTRGPHLRPSGVMNLAPSLSLRTRTTEMGITPSARRDPEWLRAEFGGWGAGWAETFPIVAR